MRNVIWIYRHIRGIMKFTNLFGAAACAFVLTSCSGAKDDSDPSVHASKVARPNVAAESGVPLVCGISPDAVSSGKTVTGSDQADSLLGSAGNDSIDGGAGIDSLVYSCPRGNYQIAKTATGWTISSAMEGTDTVTNVERLEFSDMTIALDTDENAGKAYRLYHAAFNRTPDVAGLTYWVDALDRGADIYRVAETFVNSVESATLYGNTISNESFVSQLYANVLRRAGDPSGYAYWVNLLNGRNISRTDVLMSFSESEENKSNVFAAIRNGISLHCDDKPVAVAPTHQFRVTNLTYLDGSASFDPMGRPLTFRWVVKSAPAKFPGFGYSDDKGRVGFHGVWTGTYHFSLTVNNGFKDSDPLAVQVEFCCDQRTSLDEVARFISKFPKYSTDDAKKLYASRLPMTGDEKTIFQATYGFSEIQMDYLTGQKLGTSFLTSKLGGGVYMDGVTFELDQMIQIPTEISEVKYPEDFQKSRATTVTVTNPACDYAPKVTYFPAQSMGDWTLPPIQVTPIPNKVMRVAALLDVWKPLNPTYVPGCFADIRDVIRRTLDRLAALHVDTVIVSPWSAFDGRNDVWHVLDSNDLSLDSSMNDEGLIWATAEIKKRGMKVFWFNQIQIARKTDQQNYLSTEANPLLVNKCYDALESYLLERSKLLESLGVDGIVFGSWYWANFEGILESASFVQRTNTLLEIIKRNFSGKVVYDASELVATTELLNSKIDYYHYSPQAFFSPSTIGTLSVANLKEQYLKSINQSRAILSKKPTFMMQTAPSRYDQFWTGYVELSSCTAGFGIDGGPESTTACIQRDRQTDFAIQALIHEATLEAMFSQNVTEVGAVAFPYGFDENLTNLSYFPSLSPSIRNKPAESVIYQWYKRQ